VQGFQTQIAQPYTSEHSEDFRPENVCRTFSLYVGSRCGDVAQNVT
jgi:hypothetical protein